MYDDPNVKKEFFFIYFFFFCRIFYCHPRPKGKKFSLVCRHFKKAQPKFYEEELKFYNNKFRLENLK